MYLLIISITILFFMLSITYVGTKQYYTIKSSMTLFLKLLEAGNLKEKELA